jgi:undecaprenyl-diphosphatase
MPSLLVTFTVALGVAVMFFSRKMGITIIVLAIAAGIGRIAAGIHYPSDIVVGALLGAGIAWGYKVIFRDIKRRASL